MYLIMAGTFEVGMVYALNRSNGFVELGWSGLTLLAAAASLTCLSLGMVSMEAGVAYSIWVAFGSIGAILLGAFVFHDQVNKKQLFFMALIIVAVIGLKIWG